MSTNLNTSLNNYCALARCHVSKDLRKCSACSEVFYCCKDHQVEHFKEGGHKFVCPGRQKCPPLTFQECSEKAQENYIKEKWDASLPYYGGMLELTQRVFGLNHIQVANVLSVIANIYRMTEKVEFEIACLQKQLIVMHLTDKGTTEEYRAAFTVMGRMGELYLKIDNVPLAKEMLVKTEEIAVKEFGEQSFERGRCLCALASCYERSEQRSEAERHLRLAISLSAYGTEPEPANMLAASNGFFNLAVILIAQQEQAVDLGPLQEAVVLLRRTVELRRGAGLTDDHPEVAKLLAAIDGCEADIAEGRSLASATTTTATETADKEGVAGAEGCDAAVGTMEGVEARAPEAVPVL